MLRVLLFLKLEVIKKGTSDRIYEQHEQEEETPPWVKEKMGWNHEEAEAFKDELAGLCESPGPNKLYRQKEK